MANVKTVKITGLKELEKNLLKLQKLADSRSPSSKVLNAATKSGLQEVKKDAVKKYKTISDTGHLAKTIIIKQLKYDKRNMFGALVGFREGRPVPKSESGYYGYMQEEGVKPGKKRGGPKRKNVVWKKELKAKHFFAKAYESKKKEAVRKVREMLKKGLNREINKLKV